MQNTVKVKYSQETPENTNGLSHWSNRVEVDPFITDEDYTTVKILKFRTPPTIAIIVLKIDLLK